MEAFSDTEDYLTCKNIKLRNYQIKIVEEAKKQNSIVFLPTGSGKTLISIHVLSSKMSEVIGPFPEKAKRIFVIGPTKVLVNQLFRTITTHTRFKVGMYTGDMGLDFWNKDKWNEEFQKYQVLIMTAEILKQILQLKFIETSQISLIIFDECHHAILEHPYKLILQHINLEPTSKAPLILGLSAVLLNANPKKKRVKDIISSMKASFRAKILTGSNVDDVKRFSATPQEEVILYNSDTSSVKFLLPLYDEVISLLDTIVLKSKLQVPIPASATLYSNQNSARKLKNYFERAKDILEQCGLFCGSLALLYYIILCEKNRLLSAEADSINVLVYCRTMLYKLRHIIFKYMVEETGESIFEHSSNKIQVLLTLLKKIKEKEGEKHGKIIIFVKQKVFAVVIATMLKRLKEVDPNFSFLKVEFVIGSSMYDSEILVHEFDNENIIKQFSSQNFNTLVATNILEEGLDVSDCNAVISFDFPVSYASYFQSKGRARAKEGFYFIFIKKEDMQEKTNLLTEYKQIEVNLYKEIEGDEAEVNLDDSVEMDEKDLKTLLAIRAVYRYCGKLPQDKFSFLSPTAWYSMYNGPQKMFQASVLLPVNCPITDVIEGEIKTNSRLAKRSAFFMVLEKLQAIGEIDDNYNVISFEKKASDFDYLFPHFKIEKVSKKLPQPGTRKRKQIYEVKFASCLSECLPQPGQKVYVHVIDFTIKFDKIEREQKMILQEVLQNPVTFAILSSKKLRKICGFPMFLDMGRIDCNLLINYDECILSKSELDDIKLCHFSVFQKVLRIIKNMQVFDNRNKGHAFYVVPVKKNESGKFALDWEIIRSDFCTNNPSAVVRYNSFHGGGLKGKYYEINSETLSTSDALMPVNAIDGRLTLEDNPYEPDHITITEAACKDFIISPTYRNVHPPQLYFVTKICHDLSPLSPFPNENFEDFCTYYEKKYMIKINNEKQPLLKVAFIFNCANFNKPKSSGNQEKVRGAQKNLEELLVPELCEILPFDRRYWLKALLIPTALNRICHLYYVEEFRRKIVDETGLGELEFPLYTERKPLDVDLHLTKNEDIAKKLKLALPLSQIKDKSKPNVNFIDPKRKLLEISVCDLEYLVKLSKNEKHDEDGYAFSYGNSGELQIDDCLIMVKELQGISVPSLKVLKGMGSRFGPDLAQLLQAFTSLSANDIVNYERLEILGDSFLKFAVSVYLFKNFNVNEGMLSSLKGKMIGNQNLLYCGLAKGFQYVLNVTETTPLSDWNPPLVCLPEKLVNVIMTNEIDPAAIYRWEIPSDEQFSGNLTEGTMAKNKEITEKYQRVCEFPTNSLLPYKTISDKTVSDSVEAVIGLYLSEFGLPGGFEILMWFDILPKSSGSYNELMKNVKTVGFPSTPSDTLVMNNLGELFYLDLEETLGYRFKNKALLLEALTHPSYGINRITNCYQRLEFLGDAVLDFLITCYVYEYCGNVTPGEVTDIRSFLVNNITFACLSVRYNFHKYLLKMNSWLNKAIEEFVSFQINRNHAVDENVMLLSEEKDSLIAEAIQVPKALGDVFESLAGAIYLDSDNSLETVWTIFYRLMKTEIDAVKKSVPKNSVRLLYEVCQEKPYFEMELVDGVMRAGCTVWYENTEIKVHGFGTNKKEAKRSAAKVALKKITELKK